MAVSLTPQNKQTLKRLLKTGRWNNESEIVRAAIHEFDQKVQVERLRDVALRLRDATRRRKGKV